MSSVVAVAIMFAFVLAVGVLLGISVQALSAASWRSTMGGNGDIATQARLRVLSGMDDERLETLARAVADEMGRRPALAETWDLA